VIIVAKILRRVLTRIGDRQLAKDDSGIDYSDIPALTNAQLAEFRRTPKVLVAARLDRDVYEWLQRFGRAIPPATISFSERL
jgi:uncharacterized protein (DUF4415 family)